jgi:hypothetical protein
LHNTKIDKKIDFLLCGYIYYYNKKNNKIIMGKIVRLTESELTNVIRRIVNEQENTGTFGTLGIEWERLKKAITGDGTYTTKGESLSKDLEDAFNWLSKKAEEIKKASQSSSDLKKKH